MQDEREPQSAEQIRKVECQICDKLTEAKRASKKYCSVDCRKIGAWLENQPLQNLIVYAGRKLIHGANARLDKDAVSDRVIALCEKWVEEAEQLQGELGKGSLL